MRRSSPTLEVVSDTLRCLYVCYLSLDDPLVHSQVVSYLEGLAARGHTVHLLTFDLDMPAKRRHELKESLERRGIAWHSLRYHKKPSLPATVYDALAGALAAVRIMRRHRLDTIHARNHVPAATALIVSRIAGCRFIFDLRGLMAEEYVDAGLWRRGGVAYRITDRMQRTALKRADGIVMLTDAVRRYLSLAEPSAVPLSVIPCCADLAGLNGGASKAREVRTELRIGDRPVLVYVGKFTGWYMEREMVEFFAAARRERPELLFLVITQSEPEIIEREFKRAKIAQEDYRVTRVAPDDVGRHLQVAELGISFVRPTRSKISSSPTKIGEYLGAGLPVVSTAGIGDVDSLLIDESVGVLVGAFEPSSYDAVAREAFALASDPAARERCRRVARTRLSLEEIGIPRYDQLYRAVAGAR
jgi:glycosyltransferase involved in cell wall biosynthesis